MQIKLQREFKLFGLRML